MPTQTQQLLLQILEEMKKLTPRTINPNHLLNDSRYFTKEGGKTPFYDNIQPTSDVDPVTRTIRRRGVQVEDDLGLAVDAQVVVPPGQIWEVVGIVGLLDAAAVVAARACGITMLEPTPLLALIQTITLPALAVAADEFALIVLSSNPGYWTETTAAGVILVVGGNPLPKTLMAGSTVNMVSTNLNLGDVTTLSVLYREVN